MFKYVIAAGGTGGHIYSAISLGSYLSKEKGQDVVYFSGDRELDYKLFEKFNVMHFKGRPLVNKKSIFGILKSIYENCKVVLQVFKKLRQEEIDAVIGVGGYICGPVLFAGFLLRIPVFTLEQNSVMGLTNKLTSFFSKKVFISYRSTRPPSLLKNRVVFSGNPIRKEFYLGSFHHQVGPKKKLNILIFGGSLGSDQVNEFIGYYLKNCEGMDLSIVHQLGAHNTYSVNEEDICENIIYRQFPYLENILEFYSWADIIISRAGAGSLSEFKYVKKPSILIPYSFHKDNHQLYNAEAFKDEMSVDVQIWKNISRENFSHLAKQLNLMLEQVGKDYNLRDGKNSGKIPRPDDFKEEVIERPEEIIYRTIHDFI